MLAYERASWTDEHLNATPPKERFELPEVEGGHARWRWVEGSEWHLESSEDGKPTERNEREDEAWIYYDNKWQNGRRGKDGWGRYTRRRKWRRDAELVEVTPSTEVTPSPTPKLQPEAVDEKTETQSNTKDNGENNDPFPLDVKDDSSSSQSRRKYWFKRSSQPTSEKSMPLSSGSVRIDDDDDDDEVHSAFRQRERQETWGLGDDAQMELG